MVLETMQILDDDNDGFTDLDELVCDSDPLDRFNKPADQDSDLIPDCVDPDRRWRWL